jgi:hypothetical protein
MKSLIPIPISQLSYLLLNRKLRQSRMQNAGGEHEIFYCNLVQTKKVGSFIYSSMAL